MYQSTKCILIVHSLHNVHLAELSLYHIKCKALLIKQYSELRLVCLFAANHLSSSRKCKQRRPQWLATRLWRSKRSIPQTSREKENGGLGSHVLIFFTFLAEGINHLQECGWNPEQIPLHVRHTAPLPAGGCTTDIWERKKNRGKRERERRECIFRE